ncbi:hypothetical protein I6G76_01595 (plasmid) [Bacillus cereus]|uniref:Uncharacterized protein n=1 Tax=Bacillus cereus (strain ZK / E33L) TaxID=288681 RepID=Q4V282_BACCZ|nr:hypothetical protein [Bacillus cereus]AAY60175.1 hypothetical protein pE33L466_0004 [Bacillus cereus E33L]AJI26143.1 hypothetical protein BF28_5793 [Bacillus cereus E33L]QQA19016.1 hypothetical protein I6G76_01595 [Bacillus cereus]
MFYINKCIITLLFFLFVFPSISFAETEMNPEQQAFLNFEEEISDLVISSVKPLDKLDKMNGKLSEEELYNLALSVGKNFAANSDVSNQLQVPNMLSDDIKASLETVKNDLSMGFTELEGSMIYFARYIASRDSTFYDKYTQKRDNGFRYVDGGLTSLSTIGLRLNILGKGL